MAKQYISKIHLVNYDCQYNWSWQTTRCGIYLSISTSAKTKKTSTLEEVTCKKCIQLFHHLPITLKIK